MLRACDARLLLPNERVRLTLTVFTPAVREKGEKRERVSLPPLPPSTKFTSKLMTRNLAALPKDDAPRSSR